MLLLLQRCRCSIGHLTDRRAAGRTDGRAGDRSNRALRRLGNGTGAFTTPYVLELSVKIRPLRSGARYYTDTAGNAPGFGGIDDRFHHSVPTTAVAVCALPTSVVCHQGNASTRLYRADGPTAVWPFCRPVSVALFDALSQSSYKPRPKVIVIVV